MIMNIKRIADDVKVNNNFKTKQLINIYELLNFTFEKLKDNHLTNHNMVAANVGVFIAQQLGWSPEKQSIIYNSLIGHDIGKSSIADSTICGSHRLSEKERVMMDTHAFCSGYILSAFDEFRKEREIDGKITSIADNAKHHHLRFDSGMTDPFIDVCVIADSFSAMIANERLYNRRSTDLRNVVFLLLKEKNKQFNGEILEVFINALVNTKHKEEYLNPDLSHVNEIFGTTGPYITEKEFFKYLENIIDKNNTMTIPINGEYYKIKILGEPYIISQEPNLATIVVHDGKDRLKAIIRKKKFIFTQETAKNKMGLSVDDIKKADFIIDANSGFYKFTDLIDFGEIASKVSKFGLLTDDLLRVALNTDNINIFINNEDIVEISHELMGMLKKVELIDEMGNILNYKFFKRNIRKLKLKYLLLRKSKNIKIKKFYRAIANNILSLLEAKYISSVVEKREKIIEFVLETINNEDIIHTVMNFVESADVRKKLALSIDSFSTYNIRALPKEWIKKCSEYFEKELGTKNSIYNILLMYFYLTIAILPDRQHFVNKKKEIIFNLSAMEKVLNRMIMKYPLFADTLEKVRSLNKLIYYIENNKLKKVKNFSQEVIYASLAVKFLASNGNIPYIERIYKDIKEKNKLWEWITENELLINPAVVKAWVNIKNNL